MKAAGPDVKVAMRSSAMGEDTESSFAGQYLTVLNLPQNSVLNAYKKIIASKYSTRAMYYRINYGLSDLETPMAVLVVEMIDAQTSGIIYTKDIDNPEAEYLKIHSSWGLGELLVSGEISADIFTVAKEAKPQIVDKVNADKHTHLVNLPNGMTAAVPLDDEKRQALSLADKPVLVLSEWGMQLESYFKEPQDIEWCMDKKGQIFLLQSRPLRAGAENPAQNPECDFDHFIDAKIISGGESASAGIGAGTVFKIDHENSLDDLPPGAVLVARNASPRYVKIMSRLKAVVTDTGSTASHSFRRTMSSYQLRWITGQLATGNAPMSYADLDLIKAEGIDAIVNLCGEFCDLHEIEEKSGFEVFYLPIPDESAPDMEEMEMALAWLDEAIYLGKKILVHCHHGIGRTGTFMTSYLIRKGLGLKVAEKKLKGTRANSTNYSQWRLLKKYSKKSGVLTIREPSLESNRLVDLSGYFADYEALVHKIDEDLGAVKSSYSQALNCGAESDDCCYRYIELDLIEAIYLSNTKNRFLGSDFRKRVIHNAVQINQKTKKMIARLKKQKGDGIEASKEALVEA
jgi:protein-tyrosine phosphatase